MTDLLQALAETGAELGAAMEERLQLPGGPEAPVWKAMRYACLGTGKRLRPFLTMQASSLFDVPPGRSRQAALSVEFVHCYSLIHDDLPAMDDAALRRGQPTVHREFDEATAILAGDGLLTLAFALLAEPKTHPDPAVRISLVSTLTKAAGASGMVGGQMMDMVADAGARFSLPEVERLQSMKTGALITASCEVGAILGDAGGVQRHALRAYGQNLGIAFQVADDLLDTDGDAIAVGKDLRRDDDAGKATFVTHLGKDQARQAACDYAERAIDALSSFDSRADRLRQVARFTIERER